MFITTAFIPWYNKKPLKRFEANKITILTETPLLDQTIGCKWLKPNRKLLIINPVTTIHRVLSLDVS